GRLVLPLPFSPSPLGEGRGEGSRAGETATRAQFRSMLSSSSTFDPTRRALAAWLFACCTLVFAMMVVGAITRLTHSGLSIVEWQPIVGAVPPLDAAQWEEAFAKYRETPEFRLRN